MPSSGRVSGRRLATTLVLLIAVAGGTEVARADVPAPDQDPFYDPPANVASLPDGAIIRSRESTSGILGVPLPARSWQVLYKTVDNHDRPTATVTTIMVPTVPPPVGGPRPVLSYQVAEDGLSTRCAPSFALRGGLAAPPTLVAVDTAVFTQSLLLGWTVVTPDYEGPRSTLFGAAGSGRAVLDGLRAARAFKPAEIDPKAPAALWGYSGGANATVGAAQLRDTHAPDLQIAGYALGGVVGDVRASIKALSGGALGGTLTLGLTAIDRSYPEANLTSYLNAAGKAAVASSQDDCSSDAISKGVGARIDQFIDDPSVLDGPELEPTFRKMNPITFPGVPSAPVYDYHAVNDQVAPIGPDRVLMDRFCRAGTTVQKVEDPVTEHIGAFALGVPGALTFLTDRFAGRPATSTCGPQRDPQAAAATPVPATCRAGASSRPKATVLRSALRVTRSRVIVRGKAVAGCEPTRSAASSKVRRVAVSIARVTGGRCRFLTPRGRLTTARPCARPVQLPVRGTTSWRLSRPARLPAGRYRIDVRATDAGGRRQAAARAPALRFTAR